MGGSEEPAVAWGDEDDDADAMAAPVALPRVANCAASSSCAIVDVVTGSCAGGLSPDEYAAAAAAAGDQEVMGSG